MRRHLVMLSLLLGVVLGFVALFLLRSSPSQEVPLAKKVEAPATAAKVAEAPQEPAAAPLASPTETLLMNIIKDGSAPSEFAAVSSIIQHFRKHLGDDKTSKAVSSQADYSPAAFEAVYRKKLSELLNADELTELDKLNSQTLMRQFTEAERQFLSDPTLAAATLYFRRFKIHPPSKERLSLLKRFDTATHLSSQAFASLGTLAKPLQQVAKKVSHRPLSEALVRKGILVKLAECLKDLSDEEIRKLMQLLLAPIKQKELTLRHAAIVETLQNFDR